MKNIAKKLFVMSLISLMFCSGLFAIMQNAYAMDDETTDTTETTESENNSLVLSPIVVTESSDAKLEFSDIGVATPVLERIIDFYLQYKLSSEPDTAYINASTVINYAINTALLVTRMETATILLPNFPIDTQLSLRTIGVWDKRANPFTTNWVRQPNKIVTATTTIVDDDISAPSITLYNIGNAIILNPIVDLQSGVKSWNIEITRYGESYYTTGQSFDTPQLSISPFPLLSPFLILQNGEYDIEVTATNGDMDRGTIDQETNSAKIENLAVVIEDDTPPVISLTIIENQFNLLDFTSIALTIYDFQTGILSWSVEFTRFGEPYGEPYGEIYSYPKIIPITRIYTIDQWGQYHIKITATNGDIDGDGDEIKIIDQDFKVYDYSPPKITITNAEDMTDENPLIVNVNVVDDDSGLSSVVILFGMNLDVIGQWIWIPIDFTSESELSEIINTLFDYLLNQLGIDPTSPEMSWLIELIVGDLIENLISEEIIAIIGEIINIIPIETLNAIITAIRDLIIDVMIDLIFDEDFVAGQLSYDFSIDMNYFSIARLFGEFQVLVLATNNDFEGHKESWIGLSQVYELRDDDTSFDITDPIIYGNQESIIVEFTDIDYSGVSLVFLLVDNVPILPCFYTITIVDNEWKIEISKCILCLFGQDFHTLSLIMRDNDEDWIVSFLVDPTYAILNLEFELIPPQISYAYTGDGTDANCGIVIFSVSDDSSYTIISGQLENALANQIDTAQQFTLVVEDVFGNRACKTVCIHLIDDDTTIEIADLSSMVSTDIITISFTDIDPSGIISFSNLVVDGISITDYSLSIVDNVWTITFANAWIFELGTHEVSFDLTDGDNDRENDATTSTITTSFEMTEEILVAWIDERLEELKVMVMGCTSWKQNQGNGKGSGNNHYQTTMIQKIDEVIALKEMGDYCEARNKLIHDILPKLTEDKNAWITSEEDKIAFQAKINLILTGLNILI